MKPFITTLCISALLATTAPLRAADTQENEKADSTVTEALQSAGVGYKLDEDGNFHLTVKYKIGRSQKVLVRSTTIQLGPEPDGDDMREIYSVAFVSSQPPSPGLAARLLEESGTAKIGGWVVRKVGDKFEIAFRAIVPADMCEDELIPAISIVASFADSLEKAETNKDEN